MELLTERHADEIAGTLSCFDRVVISGTIPGVGYPEGMSAFLRAKGVRLFDYTQWAAPLREEVRLNAEKVARDNGVTINYLRSSGIRKESEVAEIIAQRGDHPGLVTILSAMEQCPSFQPWHDKQTHHTFLRFKQAKCLHYYFYFILEDFGLCYLRVPTWAPFRLQFYFNGHNALAAALRKHGIDFEMVDNAFLSIDDWDTAQLLAEEVCDPKRLHARLDELAEEFCPVIRHFPQGYHWSLMQVEYASDIVFRRPGDLAVLYEELTRTAIHAVKVQNVATFLGRKLDGRYQGEAGGDYHTRVEGTRIKHVMGKVGIKMYDKFHRVLRIETTANDVSFFRHYRSVVHRDGTDELKQAPVKKSIHSLPIVASKMHAANGRYLRFISQIEDPSVSYRELDKLSRPAKAAGRSWRGFNLFHGEDADMLRVLLGGEFTISGFRNSDLRHHLPDKTAHQVSRFFKRLRVHGLIKKIAHAHKYYLTSSGRRAILLAVKVKEMFIVPTLRGILVNHS